LAEEYNKNVKTTETIPLMPLRNTVVFPHQVIPLAVGREKSLNLLKGLGDENKIIGLVARSRDNARAPRSQ